MNLLASFFEAIAQFFGFIKQDQDYHNSLEMKANADAKQIAQDKGDAIADVNDSDLKKLREDVAE
jgi:hypothetical protein